MNAISIILAEADSVDVAVALFKAQLEEHEIFTSEEALRAVTNTVVSDSSRGFILLARDDDGSFVGIAYAASHLSAEHGGTIGWLEELYVQPEWRSRGAGSSLLESIIARARQLAWRAVELEVVAGHERAVPLYKRHGFQSLNRARFSRIFEPREGLDRHA